MTNKPIYIMSLEASDIYYHNHRQMDLKKEYVGMIPYSLESIKLLETGLKTKYIEKRDKYISDDIINVKFNSKVKNAEVMYNINKKKLEYATNDDYIDKLIRYGETLQHHNEDSDDYWDSLSVEDLRKELYLDGFKIEFTNYRTGNSKIIEYVVYKRSSAKSRTGQCLFIKKSLHKKMMDWSRMKLPFRKGQKVDLASLLAYESLVGSSLESTININPNNILIVDDVESRFKQVCNVVRTNKKTGFLDSFKEETEVVNSLFDGESLLESSYFTNGKGMMLLRNHMFKSASFNCEIQRFLKDNCPTEIEYEDWQIDNMYGEPMYAKDIHMIITPSSLKALKFSHVLPTKSEAEMWNYWKRIVEEEASLFGICKYEKASKIGYDDDNNILQQTSYQMLNCLPVNEDDIEDLICNEIHYIDKLKSDDNFLMEEIYRKKDLINSNEALYSIYKVNSQIVKTGLFKKFKKKFIHNKIIHAKKGKIKIKGDYCVLLGNPMELLYHAIGEFNINTSLPELVGNEVYSSLHENEKELIGFRNPNTSPSNVLIMKNKYISKINEYFNLTRNIISVNAINFAIQDILSGCDYDSDTILVSNEEKLVDIGKRCFGQYDICVNNIKGQKKEYKLNNDDHCEIDIQLSHSQRNIGKVVNLGQFCMSTYWDLVNNGISGEHVDELLKKVDVMTILSGIAIDMAKKFYDIDMHKEISHVSKNEELSKKKQKPLFWVNVSQNPSIKDKVEAYKCPMDYLIDKMSNLPYANHTKSIPFDEIINDFSTLKINAKQMQKVHELIISYNTTLKKIQLYSIEEKRIDLENLEKETINKLKGWKLKADTISMILKNTYLLTDEFLLKTLKLLHKSHQEELLKTLDNR